MCKFCGISCPAWILLLRNHLISNLSFLLHALSIYIDPEKGNVFVRNALPSTLPSALLLLYSINSKKDRKT